MIKASVYGATGYAGAELMRLLCGHPEVRLVSAISKTFEGKPLSDIYANFRAADISLEAGDLNKIAGSDVVFTALPHGLSQQVIPALLDKGVKVIDLSGDFRYDDVEVYEHWYQLKHNCPELSQEAVYGLCELYREQVRHARLVGNPGCYTTCSILPLYPLLQDGLVNPEHIIIDAKSGVTGAGRKEKLDYSFCETDENFKAYGIATHRHTSEIEQELSKAAGRQVQLSFTPHLLPVKRGILATIYADLTPGVTRAEILTSYQRYAREPFIRIYEKGLPELKHVTGSNNTAIGFVIDERLHRAVIVSCLDNLIKGAAGQAVQNMNLLFDLPETTGLSNIAWYL